MIDKQNDLVCKQIYAVAIKNKYKTLVTQRKTP